MYVFRLVAQFEIHSHHLLAPFFCRSKYRFPFTSIVMPHLHCFKIFLVAVTKGSCSLGVSRTVGQYGVSQSSQFRVASTFIFLYIFPFSTEVGGIQSINNVLETQLINHT